MASGLLEGIRVLDLTDQRAELAGRLLGELGADVLKIEPPGGIASRRLAPFDKTSGASLYWAALGLGKKSAVLDLDSETGRAALRELASRADILIESADPGNLPSNGLGPTELCSINPRLIYLSVTPYGQGGPKSRWPATDLTLEAAGGRLALQGDRDRPPLPVGYPQAAFHAGARAAADALIALNERDLSGLGQYLDTSMQEAVIWTLMSATGYPSNTGGDPPGAGDDRAEAPRRGAGNMLGLLPCADGYVTVSGTSQAQLLETLKSSVLPELRRRGQIEGDLAGLGDEGFLRSLELGEFSTEQTPLAMRAIQAFLRLKTKRELMEWAWENDVHLGPLNTTRDLLEHPHLAARGYWQKVGPYLLPGPAVHPSRTPVVYMQPAPALGEHQAELESWLKTAPQIAQAAPGVGQEDGPFPFTLRLSKGEREMNLPLSRLGEAFVGLKVVDFSWVAVGPITAKAFADHGATVVRVESSTRVDFARTLLPFKDGVTGINRSHWVNNLNTSKLGVALNFRTEEGRKLARRLIDWADVIVENYTPGTMDRLGFGYQELSRTRPELIMLSTCLMGQTGPWASFAGYGPHGAAISGLSAITGWPDRAPCGPNGPYSDVIAPHYAVAALAAAIWERRRSGLGQHIDVSQVEAAIHFLEPLVLDESVNGRTAPASGLNSLNACPHGVYKTAGIERYIAIAVETPEQWRALKLVAPLSEFDGAAFDSLDERRAASDRIDASLRDWASGYERGDLELLLVKAGVPASVVQRPTELCADPHLADRGFFVTLQQSEVGAIPYDGFITRFSAKQKMMHKAAPSIGEDTEYVLTQLLGLSHDEVADLAAWGVLT